MMLNDLLERNRAWSAERKASAPGYFSHLATRQFCIDLAQAQTEEERCDRLAELNVVEGVRRVSETPILQRAWARGDEVAVHGLIYGLKDGLLRDLDCTVGHVGLAREITE